MVERVSLESGRVSDTGLNVCWVLVSRGVLIWAACCFCLSVVLAFKGVSP